MFWKYWGLEYTRVVNILGFSICFRFWVCQGSGYTTVEYVRVTQGSEYAWIIPGYVWLCLNLPKSVWMAFVLHLLIVIPYLREPFFESKHLICSIVVGSMLCFRPNIFTSKISSLLLPLGGWRIWVLWILPNQWDTQLIYLWYFFNDLFIYFVVVFFTFWYFNIVKLRESSR